jgi:hypothetical protein
MMCKYPVWQNNRDSLMDEDIHDGVSIISAHKIDFLEGL